MSFQRLRIYKLSINGVQFIYSLTRNPTIRKDFSLIDQIRRASFSVTANIAEGYGRKTKKDRAQFLTYAIGSSNEVISYLDIIDKVYPKIATLKEKSFYESLGRQIYSFRNKLPNS